MAHSSQQSDVMGGMCVGRWSGGWKEGDRACVEGRSRDGHTGGGGGMASMGSIPGGHTDNYAIKHTREGD